ncbi:MAG: RNA polymerase-associated protein RapA [Elusimicrobia bacterium]|nr:RNA polymerase-associated protein RapA [Elusimicrobiota bacterium]
MPRIFDNIEEQLLPALRDTIDLSDRADFCVGYFNLRGWKALDSHVERWSGGEGHCCRLLVGMQRMPIEEINTLLGLVKGDGDVDQAAVLRIKKELVEQFKEQLTIGAPTNDDEVGLRRLAAQIKAKKVVIKLFLRHPLHAKLYLLFRPDPINPTVGYLGSSNLTMSGLARQGELNVDVLDGDACGKLARWFEDRWNDRWCIDISADLVKVIEESWAREELIPPYQIYVKMAYHLSREAREGISEFQLPSELKLRLFAFQEAAVKIAAHHLNKRGGVLLGDVVGLGKTLMATALARMFEDDYDIETLILCPKNLLPMWNDYRERYHLRGKVLPISLAIRELPNMRRYRLVVIDESHNLRNREGRRYSAIRDYVKKNDSKCILLSATPYNKTYLDLANQLRLFLPEDQELPIRPESLLAELGETEFVRRHQCSPRSLAAFEKSPYADDWRELMRLYLVRRTRTFIMENYAKTDPTSGRKYLPVEDGKTYSFPTRVPKAAKFIIGDAAAKDQYAKLYAPNVVDIINHLHLPRYGLGNYVHPMPDHPPSQDEAKIIQNLSRAGKRLMGFCRTNLFKRLESGGWAFLQSIERHILRNHVYLHALRNGLDLPIGTQDADLLDPRFNDEDAELGIFESEDNGDSGTPREAPSLLSPDDFSRRSIEIYGEYVTRGKSRFDWLRATLFEKSLTENLQSDADDLLGILLECGKWIAEKDAKLNTLFELLFRKHPDEKVIIFSQFADTVDYLTRQLEGRGITGIAGVTGDSIDPTGLAWRFSPDSNEKRHQVGPDQELRILIATDVLSEGQNLQDCAVVINYDLPWAIIRLVQRIGRVDRIGQKAENILCYTFLPADGVERIIRLRARVRQRLQENAEVVGTDEAFFEDDRNDQVVRDLFTENAGILDGDADTEVDLASYAYQIWKNAISVDPKLEKIIPDLSPVAYSTKSHNSSLKSPEGVLVYLRTAADNDALVWVNPSGQNVTESQKAILDAAKCPSDAPALPRAENHHSMVRQGVEFVLKEERTVGGQLGRPSGARFRTYERLKRYTEDVKNTLFDRQELHRAIEEIYRYPLREAAKDSLNRLLRSRVSDEDLAQKVVALRDADALCVKNEGDKSQEPRIICSLGLSADQGRR